MTEVSDVFIDFDTVRSNLSESATMGGVRYRQRPKDTGCLHINADCGKAVNGIAEVTCLDCGHGWNKCAVVVPR